MDKNNRLPTILCVDDEKIVLNTLLKQLSSIDDYEIELAESGAEALEILIEVEQAGGEVHLVVSDQIMPDMSGVELLAKVFQHDKNIISILLTGYADTDSTINLINQTNLFRYIEKPWEQNDFMMSIREGLIKRQSIDKLHLDKETFEKFVPKEFLNNLGIEYKDSNNLKPGLSKTIQASILFADIRNFVEMTEQNGFNVVFQDLSTLLADFAIITAQYNGFVDKYIGDAIMSIFSCKDGINGANNAIQAAIAMHKKVNAFNKNWEVGIGIATGEVVIAAIGSDDRLDTTVFGNTVNIASRLESSTKINHTSIVIDEHSYNHANDQQKLFTSLELDIKGKDKKILAYACTREQVLGC